MDIKIDFYLGEWKISYRLWIKNISYILGNENIYKIN